MGQISGAIQPEKIFGGVGSLGHCSGFGYHGIGGAVPRRVESVAQGAADVVDFRYS
jgi:hypothetical protein